MRWSRYYIPTLKEAPADAEVVSHKLLVRAGMIRKLTSGIYTWLPLGLRTLEKAKAIVRREMNAAGALETLLPMVQPGELWEESGRWKKYGKELLRFKDRHDRDYCLGPTHEEVMTDLLRGEVKSYRQLPLNLYQIQTKYRDEVRPRFGLMRGREFLMKDAYSFDVDDEGANKSYAAMKDAYHKIFSSMGLDFRPVEADSGAIGGNYSHEFMVLAETGEDAITACTNWPACTWAANVERAPIKTEFVQDETPCPAMEEMDTPEKHSIEELCEFLGVTADKLIKTLLFMADGKAVAVLLRGDRELNEIKLAHLIDADDIQFATPEQVQAMTGAAVGFAGPAGLQGVEKIYADKELMAGNDWIAGANKTDKHVRHLSLIRDVALPIEYADLRNAVAGDPCPECGQPLEIKRGIEVGHIFKLGTKYSEALRATFLDENGKERIIVMGCYGIGVSRVVAACIEQNFDENGIKFPPQLAPYDAQIVCLDPKDKDVASKSDCIEAFLEGMGLECLYDDREERPGVKFKDADLIGLPVQITVGGKGLKNGVIEVKNRRTGEKSTIDADKFEMIFPSWYDSVLESWKR
ncbi:proline--tRNA ligase [Mailhella sp.]|uniref:proline--tRNA ligase n=1 Tax=Mailhella sp. TaxID=1981029 RepID=UPI004064A1AB